MYENYIYGAILGSGNQYIYANESSSIIKDEVLKVYNEIIDKDNGTYTAKILTQYVDELSKDNGDLNGQNTLYFYENIHEIIHLNSK
jgi:folate-dependent tRNA-U54 methylase TrmFO/GidA